LRVGEYGLTQLLSPLVPVTTAMGASSVSVMVFEKGTLLRMVYQWPGVSVESADLRLEADAVIFDEPWEEIVTADSTIGQFLARATDSKGSFFLVPWPDRPWKVIVAFGISRCESRFVIAQEFSPAIQLAAVAAWSAMEVQRLRGELCVVNERLARRKVVERAKGLLQARNGWTEQEAYEQLRKLSRQRRKTLAETAQELLRVSRHPTG